MADSIKTYDLTRSELRSSIERAAEETIQELLSPYRQTKEELENPAILKAFIDSITAADLQEIDIAPEIKEAFIAGFIEQDTEQKIEMLEYMDFITVYKLYEKKKAQQSLIISSSAAKRAYKGVEATQERLKLRLEQQTKNKDIRGGVAPAERRKKGAQKV